MFNFKFVIEGGITILIDIDPLILSAKDKNHYPESFFVRDDNNYIKNQVVFDVISIKEIVKNKHNKEKKASNLS